MPNPFRRKPEPKLSEADFPALNDTVVLPITQKPLDWSCEKIRTFDPDAKFYPNGDVYEGEYREDGTPEFGKMTFADGKVYEGAFEEEWIEDNYGLMTLPSGKRFWGVFRFAKMNRW
jgi:hypothetical protein